MKMKAMQTTPMMSPMMLFSRRLISLIISWISFVMWVFGTVESVTEAKTGAVGPPLRLWFLHHYLVHEYALCLIKVGCFDEDTTLEAVMLLGFVSH
jgi:hypothetical protein